jgi:hypothetical protein
VCSANMRQTTNIQFLSAAVRQNCKYKSILKHLSLFFFRIFFNDKSVHFPSKLRKKIGYILNYYLVIVLHWQVQVIYWWKLQSLCSWARKVIFAFIWLSIYWTSRKVFSLKCHHFNKMKITLPLQAIRQISICHE